MSPAAIVYLFVRSEAHEAERMANLRQRVSASIEVGGKSIHELVAQIETQREPAAKHLGIIRRRKGLPTVEGWFETRHSDGRHENVCLDHERDLLQELVRDRTVDAVHYCFGLPRSKPGFFRGKYEPASIYGRKGFVAIEATIKALSPDVESLVLPMKLLLEERWDELNSDDELVEIKKGEQAFFLRSCATLPYFRGWSEILGAAAKRAE